MFPICFDKQHKFSLLGVENYFFEATQQKKETFGSDQNFDENEKCFFGLKKTVSASVDDLRMHFARLLPLVFTIKL